VSQPPPLRRPVVSRLLRRARLAGSTELLRLANVCSRNASRLAELTTGFATSAIAPEDRSALAPALYSQAHGRGRASLFAWEEIWLARDLPRAPARVLLGGAGRGRETRWLIDRGYTVVPFDPAPGSVAQHNATCPEAPGIVLDYQSLARASYARQTGSIARPANAAAPVLDSAPYDAALIGGGSLTHVLEEHDQDALFETLAELVPHGPILASFFMQTSGTSGPEYSRAHVLGAQLGAALSRAPIESALEAGRIRCLAHAGFVYSFDRERLEELAQRSARTLALYADATYPHATFR